VAAGRQKLKQKALKSALRLTAFEPICRMPDQGEHGQEHAMRFGLGLAVLAVVGSAAGTPAFAVVCMDKSMTVDEIVDALNVTPGCDRAMALFKDCQLGASGDVPMGAAVEKKCETDFMPGLPAAKKQSYQREMGICDRKYANQDGTMYRSFTAFCRAEVSQRYAREGRKAAR
jgi:hypothetical protein